MHHPDHLPARTAPKFDPVAIRRMALPAALWRMAAAAAMSGATAEDGNTGSRAS